MQGYIKIHRKILRWGWYANENVARLFFHLILSANFEEKTWEGETLKKGEFVTSIKNLSTNTGLSAKQIRLALQKLTSTGEIVVKTTNRYTKITVCKYLQYQAPDAEELKQMAFEWQTEGNQRANGGQTDDKQRATTQERKEGKNDKNDKKDSKPPISPFVKPTIEEIHSYCMERRNGIDPEAFFAFYESKGWKVGSTPMKNWRMAVVTWEKRPSSGFVSSNGKFMTTEQKKRENTISALKEFMQEEKDFVVRRESVPTTDIMELKH